MAPAVALGACSAGQDAATSDHLEAPEATTEFESAAGEATADRDVGVDGEVPVPVGAGARGAERVRDAWIALEFDDPEAAVDEVVTTAEAHGGFVALADLLRDEHDGHLEGTLTLRVPSDELVATLAALEELAVDAPQRRIEEEDVGAELTDLRARLANLAAYERELRTLLTEVREATGDPDDLLPVVERLQSVRSDIDRTRAQHEALEDRVALSTITVELRSTRSPATIATSSWAPLRTLEEAVATTGRALATLADGAIWLLLTALPVAVVAVGPPFLLWRWWSRREVEGEGPAGPSAPRTPPATPAA